MKKTLIALAALAATGASFAQVTITGNLTSGYQQTISNAYTGGAATNFVMPATLGPFGVGTTQSSAVVVPALAAAVPLTAAQQAVLTNPKRSATTQNGASGFGVDTAEIIITAKEDIGGGQTVEAMLGLENVYRGSAAPTAFGAGDTKLTYTNTSFGRLQYGNTKGAAVFSGYPSAGAPVIDMDGKLFELRSQSEYINYAVPVGPITLVYQLGESTSGGLGNGQSGTPASVGQRSNMLLGLYRDGPLEAFLAYKTYDNGDSTSITGVNGLTKDTQWSLQGAYDFGVAKVGFGYAYTRGSVGATVADMLVGVNVPMGALEVGATFGQEIVSGIAGVPDSAFSPSFVGSLVKSVMSQADGTATGWSVGAKYNLSKRTHLKANYAAWTRSGYAQFEAYKAVKDTTTDAFKNFGYGPIETQANLLLSHSF
jgi:predicted porin